MRVIATRSGGVWASVSIVPPSVRPAAEMASRERKQGDLLEVEEHSLQRMFASLAVFLSGALLVLLPFLGGDAHARMQLGACLVVAMLGGAQLLWSLHEGEGYDVWRLLVAGSSWLLAVLAALRYFGAFSPVAVLLPLGVFFFGMTRDARAQVLAYVAAAASYFAVAISSLHGSSAAEPAITGASITPAQAMAMLAVTEIALVVTFLGARLVRGTTLLALARHERAAWAVIQKETRIDELQKDLARALDVAGVGRFSETVVGNYKLGGVIGRGAMGEVYEAVHRETGAEAAVKLLHTHTLREAGSVERFQREAKMAAALDTPHAVRILEIGGEGGDLPYLAMERLRGEDLAEHLRLRATMSFPDLLRLLTEVGKGLAAARVAGVVHRDVKPRNLFLSEGSDGTRLWKLLDFGVSKFATADATHTDGRIIGTPEYMAPEQAAGQAVTHRTDLFSLGAVAYRALTGNQAFSGDHIAEVLYQVAHTMPPRPSALADLRPEVDLVLAVALAKSADDRFDSAEELHDALLAASRGEVSVEVRARALRLLAMSPWGEAPTGEVQ